MNELAPLIDLAAPAIYGGALMFLRLGACLMLIPELGVGAAPVASRLVLALALTIALSAGLWGFGGMMVALPDDAGLLLVHVLREVLLGAALGLAVRLINAAVQMAGDLVGLSMGLSLATFFDLNAGEMPLAMGRLFALVASMLFLALGGHLVVVGALYQHFALHPVGIAEVVVPSLGDLASMATHALETAVLLASPVVVVALVLNMAMGFVMRVVPSMNLFNIGIGLLLTGGFLALALEGDALVLMLGHELDALPERMLSLGGGP